ncbi:hypothetical protein [Hirschia maritima]|uniref:hypothetical protein n=1 Tax=Hirschia maritima TaxID=1121961 RepID=UPI000371E5E2|nr:hypothetical protein [Hirschia maritima]
MSLWELGIEIQAIAILFIAFMLFAFTVYAVILTGFLSSKFRTDVSSIYPLAFSYFIAATLVSQGNPEPFEELFILLISHGIAWKILSTKNIRTKNIIPLSESE